ncbi:hypothetical protein [Chelativorans sp. YIM 93263]|uniref:hypothetical protein n=1 Tax=Chelativorans sp. YIM 93263 TaxID=2906648 RepID=UPI0023781251|nr:hypothetical protein [Chelativorans sp. YIM 93263]
MNMHYKVEVLPRQDQWWRKLAQAVGSFMKRVSNRENIVMGAPWPAHNRHKK